VLETGAYNNGIKTGPWVNLVTGTTINYWYIHYFNKQLTIAFVFSKKLYIVSSIVLKFIN
jgi:hypothetical protein